MSAVDGWPMLCLRCLLGEHERCRWDMGCECLHPDCWPALRRQKES